MRALSFLFRICSIFLVFLFTNNSLFAQVPPDVIITEVYDHPVAYGEFVEIYNAGPVSQNLNGWQLSQTFSAFSTTLNSTSLRSGDLTLSPGEYAVIGRGSAAQFREVWGFLPATYFSVGTTGAPQIDGEEYMYIWNAAGGVEDYFGTRGFQFDVTVGHYTRNMATYPNDGRLATSWFTDGYYGNPGTDNFAPVAVNDQVSVNEDLSIQIPILTNDNDLDGALMSSTVILRSQPTRGTATLFRGVVTYTPQANYYGLDSFTYTVRDNDGATSNVATVSITVNSVNDRPVAVDDRADTDEDRAVIISVLANDSDIDGTLVPSSVRVGTVPTNGRTTVIADGTIRYTPNADYYGTDSFTYVVDDNSGARSNTATVSIRVFSINDPPRTNADAAVTDEERMVEIDVLANDTDIDGRIDASSLRVSAQPANGEVRFNPTTGLFEYAPNRDFFGIDAFRYTVNDDLGATSPETRVTITVNNINDAPHVVNDLAETDEDRNVLISILANDSDSDGTINPASIVITTAPLHGTTGINFTEGIVTFIPTGNYYGSDSFRYTVRDNNGATSAQATVNITIHSVNDAPVANRDAVETNEDTPVIINVLANDTDIDGVLVPASVNAIQTLNGRGTFSVNTTTGAITYTPYANVSGEDGVLYTVEDDSGAVSNQTWAMITILPQNDPPVAGNDNAAVNEDESVVINVLSNDSDPDGSLVPSSVIIATAPRSGSTSVNSTTGAITYTPDANYFGNDAFQYTVNDNEGGVSNRATVSVTIRSVNDIPIAQDDLSSVDEDGSVVVNVLVNDSDADGSLVAASVTVVTQPQSGSTSVNPGTGAVTYTPNANYNGNDSFQYTVRDNSGDTSNRATVRITVNPVNDVPVAQDDQATVDEDRSVVINVLVNDRDPDGSLDASTVTVVTQPLSGSASVNPSTGAVTYTPAANYNGSDSFTYRVRDDGNAVSNTATVTITVNSVNDPPVAMNDLANTDEDTGVIINVLANDTDVDGTLVPGSVTVVGNPAHGSTSVNASNGAVTYTPTAAWSGNDSFTYTVRDNDGGTSLPATVNISVGAVNDAPLAVNDNAETDEDTAVLINVLTNDSDSDGNLVASTVALNSQPAHGTAQVNPANGQINYIPVENYFGPDQFTYTVDDNNGETSNAATVSITVNSVNDPPVAIDDNANTNEDTEVIIDVLVNDTDVDGTLVPASVTVVGNPGHGSTSVNPATGAVTYTPAAAWSGADSFTYTVRDNQGGVSAAATVNVDVGAVNDIPLAVNDNAETDEDIPVQINVLANDSDSDGTLVPSSVEIVGQPANGNANVNTSNGIITYNPNAGWSGIDTFRYRVSDNQGGVSAPATVTVNVGAVNDPPLAINDLVETNEDTPVAINVLTNDSDSDGSLVLASVNISALPANGNAAVNSSTGEITYTPALNYNGSDSFSYTVADNQGAASNAANVSITVVSVNDVPLSVNDDVETAEDTPVDIAVLDNDEDVDGSLVMSTVSVTSPPSHGNAEVNPSTGVIRYTPTAGWFGNDQIVYTVNDNDNAVSAPATVSVTVISVNDPPVISAVPPVAFNEDDSLTIPLATIFNYVSDPDNETAELQLVLLENPVVKAIEGEGNIVLYAPADWYGDENIRFIVSDGELADTSEIHITVNPVNDAPQIENLPDSLIIGASETLQLFLWENISDVESADSSLSINLSASNDSVKCDIQPKTGQVSIWLLNGFHGRAWLYVRVQDDSLATATDSIMVRSEIISALAEFDTQLPKRFELLQNYPNPFNPTTTIAFDLPKTVQVHLVIYNLLGQKVATLVNEKKAAGSYSLQFDGQSLHLASGVYIYRLQAGDFVQTKKMVLMK